MNRDFPLWVGLPEGQRTLSGVIKLSEQGSHFIDPFYVTWDNLLSVYEQKFHEARSRDRKMNEETRRRLCEAYTVIMGSISMQLEVTVSQTFGHGYAWWDQPIVKSCFAWVDFPMIENSSHPWGFVELLEVIERSECFVVSADHRSGKNEDLNELYSACYVAHKLLNHMKSSGASHCPATLGGVRFQVVPKLGYHPARFAGHDELHHHFWVERFQDGWIANSTYPGIHENGDRWWQSGPWKSFQTYQVKSLPEAISAAYRNAEFYTMFMAEGEVKTATAHLQRLVRQIVSFFSR